MVALPGGATLGVLLPFFGALLITALFAFIYLRRYRNPYESDLPSFLTSVISLIIVLVTSALLPLDIFIVSYMKNHDGTFKEWAFNQSARDSVEASVQASYYSLYSLVFVCLFMIIPFVYFYFEEKNDDGFGNDNRLCTAIKYTVGFIFVAALLLMVGAFVPLKDAPNANSTEWEKIEFLIDDLKKSRGEDALAMVLSILSLIGMINLVFYTAFGLFSWPMGLIRGTKSAKSQLEQIQDQHLVNQTRINALKDKERLNGGRLSVKERRQLTILEEAERVAGREEQAVDEHRASMAYKLRIVIRPLQIAIGFILICLAILIWISLLLTNIDKAVHGLGPKMGYALVKRTLPNPIDIVLVFLQKNAFPLDYILMLILTWFLVLCTLSGIRNLGIRVCGIKLFKLRVARTKPQGLLLTCVTLMLTVLAINIFVYCVSPQYATYGSQQYLPVNHTGLDFDGHNLALQYDASNDTLPMRPCDSEAKPDQCTMTRNSALLLRFFYKAWIFGAIYYWATWAFVVISGVALIVVTIRRARQLTDGLEDDEDLEEDDEGDLSSLVNRRSASVSRAH